MGLPVSVTLRGPSARGDRVDKVVQVLYASYAAPTGCQHLPQEL